MFIHFINNGFAALELILPEIGALIITGILLVSLIIGLGMFILVLAKKESRDKIKNLCKITVTPQTFVNKYKYIFTDFTFDISVILVGLMSILTENILR